MLGVTSVLAQARTDREGRYRLEGLPSETVRLGARGLLAGHEWAFSAPFEPSPGELGTLPDLVLREREPGRSIRCRIVDAAGVPAGGAAVGLHSADGQAVVPGAGGLADADGVALVGAWPGRRYLVSARHPEHPGLEGRAEAAAGDHVVLVLAHRVPEPAQAVASEPETRPESEPERGTRESAPAEAGVLEGRLLFSGEPARGWRLAVLGQEAALDEDGAFSMSFPRPGRRQVALRSPEPRPGGARLGLLFDAGPGVNEREWDLAVGTLVLENLQPEPPAFPEAELWPPFSLSASTDAMGWGAPLFPDPPRALRVEQVPAGRVVLRQRPAERILDPDRWPVVAEIDVEAGVENVLWVP